MVRKMIKLLLPLAVLLSSAKRAQMEYLIAKFELYLHTRRVKPAAPASAFAGAVPSLLPCTLLLKLEERKQHRWRLHYLWGRAVERHYKGHGIRVSAVRFPQTDRWTVRSFVSWNFANDSGEETIVHTDLEFGTVEEAMQAGVEFAIKWIDNGKQDFLTER
jgi:hypothetical protein